MLSPSTFPSVQSGSKLMVVPTTMSAGSAGVTHVALSRHVMVGSMLPVQRNHCRLLLFEPSTSGFSSVSSAAIRSSSSAAVPTISSSSSYCVASVACRPVRSS